MAAGRRSAAAGYMTCGVDEVRGRVPEDGWIQSPAEPGGRYSMLRGDLFVLSLYCVPTTVLRTAQCRYSLI